MPSLNRNLQKLVTIAQKTERLAVGLMSGTSLDGLDIALCRFDGNGFQTRCELLEFTTASYSRQFKNEVQTIFSKKTVDLEKLCLLNAFIGTFHAELVLDALQKWKVKASTIDFIASHGQTIYHAPRRLHHQTGYPNATLQIGDGDHLAVKTGIITISDFRQKHLAVGGEGAPLALYGDAMLAAMPGEDRILLNIGGISNLTYLPANADQHKIICTDIGPGNTLIDAVCQKYFNQPFDEDSQIAVSGIVNEDLLRALQAHPFFSETAPKTTGPELFNLAFIEKAQRASGSLNIHPANLVATLSVFTAKSITDFITRYLPVDSKLFVSGGGAKNPFIMSYLEVALPELVIKDTGALGISPDAKEAMLFALLGNEALTGNPIAIGGNPSVLMGKFSFPL